ncbi:DUF350 domain-containing protein [Jeotgalibacillus proteolyticus]|uniref:DUF350 domain-containing protein n=1 Tax=Jeotgalibacillus proteolyticus TaxID=2082395 RepID=A0A2S5GF98_9BACL|nr:DUF350 domain-containing protein [Jeotgalibacillus proteolyticus]PPA71585.1 DUF350 domain-containing protein [Jeotgalibacillus proteolyticus]
MDEFWQHPLIETAGYYSVVVLCMIVFLAVFELVTKYNNWEEIKNGNISVAMATGGKVFGMANIFRHSIGQHDSLFSMMAWGIYGFVLLLVAYFMFEFLTPRFRVDEEIKNNNKAVGFISMVISVGLSFVIGASIT